VGETIVLLDRQRAQENPQRKELSASVIGNPNLRLRNPGVLGFTAKVQDPNKLDLLVSAPGLGVPWDSFASGRPKFQTQLLLFWYACLCLRYNAKTKSNHTCKVAFREAQT
jgi:hypothetical protein